MTEQEMIEYTMDTFDFHRVAKVMTLLNWQWSGVGVPDEYTLRTTARKHITKCLKEPAGNEYTSSIGGFEVHVIREAGKTIYIELKFVLEVAECDVAWEV